MWNYLVHARNIHRPKLYFSPMRRVSQQPLRFGRAVPQKGFFMYSAVSVKSFFSAFEPVDMSATKLLELSGLSRAMLLMARMNNGSGFVVSPSFQRMMSELKLAGSDSLDVLPRFRCFAITATFGAAKSNFTIQRRDASDCPFARNAHDAQQERV